MPELSEAKRLLTAAGLPCVGGCRFSAELLLPGVRAAARLPQGAKTIFVALFPYFTGIAPQRNLSLYAALPDYHAIAGAMLEQSCQLLQTTFPAGKFVPFVDASPIREVQAAAMAGLGVIGENGQLLTDEYGSFVFIGEIVTDLDFGCIDAPISHCCGCHACLRACPTGALTADGLQKERCRSHFTQKKGTLTDWEREEIRAGGLVWGCDRCTLACPANRHPRITPIAAFREDVVPVVTAENLDRLLSNRAFAWRGKAVLVRNLSLFSDQTDR